MVASTSSLARLWLAAFGVGFAVIAALTALSVATPPFHGDLTRIGMVSARHFGSRSTQPAVAAEHLGDAALADADVLVIGDSFSMTREWQSVLAADRLRVATVSWAQLGEALCADTGPRLAEAGFRGRLVIIESVERLVGERLLSSATCARLPHPEKLRHPPPRRPVPGPVSDWEPNPDATLMLGWRVWQSTRRVLALDGDGRAANDTVVRGVPDGCERFSHRQCRQGLFYAHDTERRALVPEDTEKLRIAARSFGALPLVWAIVPNKTTVYVEPGRSAAFGRALAAAGMGPDLFAFARAERLAVRDFYLPDDTHLSTAGELRLGQVLLPAVRARLAPHN